MKESMKERFGPSAAVTATALAAILAVSAMTAAIPMILVVVPEKRGEELPLLDLHESFV